MILFLYSCGCNRQISENDTYSSYSDFYNFIYNREDWLIDTLFYNLSSIDLRYDNGCICQFEDYNKIRSLPIFLVDSTIFIANEPVSSFLNRVNDDTLYNFTYSADMIKMMKQYRIKHIFVHHKPRALWIKFMEKDSISTAFYIENDNFQWFKDDSLEIGWTTRSVKKRD